MKTTTLDPRIFHECHLAFVMDELREGKIKSATITYEDSLNIGEKLFSVETA